VCSLSVRFLSSHPSPMHVRAHAHALSCAPSLSYSESHARHRWAPAHSFKIHVSRSQTARDCFCTHGHPRARRAALCKLSTVSLPPFSTARRLHRIIVPAALYFSFLSLSPSYCSGYIKSSAQKPINILKCRWPQHTTEGQIHMSTYTYSSDS